jgi:hypothetical protein
MRTSVVTVKPVTLQTNTFVKQTVLRLTGLCRQFSRRGLISFDLRNLSCGFTGG